MMPAARLVALVLILLARVLLALGPDGIVLCIHEDGGVFVESTSALCCARTECASGRSVSPEESPTAPDDDCQDIALSIDAPLLAPQPAAPLDLTSVALVGLAPAVCETRLVGGPVCVAHDEREGREPDTPPPRSVVLRC